MSFVLVLVLDPFLVFLGKVQVLVFTVSMEFSPGYVPS